MAIFSRAALLLAIALASNVRAFSPKGPSVFGRRISTTELAVTVKQPKKIVNDPADAVDELIRGMLLQYPNSLAKLENHHVLLQQSLPDQKVQILSGGGSGHEPSMAGWIGDGMLSGAILGGIFASPSVASILAAIRAVGQDGKEVLLIVMNYTGDRLNFGIACERANAEGIPCQMVVVADDCALERTKGITGARGVAGTVLVHKVAGAAAAKDVSLEDVAQIAKNACRHMGTLGIALDAVTVPGASQVNDRLDDDNTIEIGLGIHGEAGLRQSSLLSANDMAKDMISTIQEFGREDGSNGVVPLVNKGDELCLLLNNLGGTSNFEMSILADSVVSLLESEYECTVTRVMVGSYMTAFGMHGASITLLNLSTAPNELTDLLDVETGALSWSSCDIWDKNKPRPSLVEFPEVVVTEEAKELTDLPPMKIPNMASADMVRAAALALADAEPLLTDYDTIVGDGDCGITMKRGAKEVLKRLDKESLNVDHLVPLFSNLADAVSASMGGTSGVLLELMFRKMSTSLARSEAITQAEVCQAVQDGVDAVSLYGGATVGSRTMLDALVPMAQSLVESEDLQLAASKAREGADGTATMKSASAGRSNYLSEDSLSGTPDPGACAAAIVAEALSKIGAAYVLK
jgi:dihydroxyacetone kinase